MLASNQIGWDGIARHVDLAWTLWHAPMPDIRIGADDFGGGAGRRGIASGYQFFRTCRREVGMEIDDNVRVHVPGFGKEMAAERGLTYSPSQPGEYVSGRLAGVANLASGRFAMIGTDSASSSCPGSRSWRSVWTNTSAASVATTAASNGVLAAIGRSDSGCEAP